MIFEKENDERNSIRHKMQKLFFSLPSISLTVVAVAVAVDFVVVVDDVVVVVVVDVDVSFHFYCLYDVINIFNVGFKICTPKK